MSKRAPEKQSFYGIQSDPLSYDTRPVAILLLALLVEVLVSVSVLVGDGVG